MSQGPWLLMPVLYRFPKLLLHSELSSMPGASGRSPGWCPRINMGFQREICLLSSSCSRPPDVQQIWILALHLTFSQHSQSIHHEVIRNYFQNYLLSVVMASRQDCYCHRSLGLLCPHSSLSLTPSPWPGPPRSGPSGSLVHHSSDFHLPSYTHRALFLTFWPHLLPLPLLVLFKHSDL